MCLVRAAVCRCMVAVYSQGAESVRRVIRVSIGDVKGSELASLCGSGAWTILRMSMS